VPESPHSISPIRRCVPGLFSPTHLSRLEFATSLRRRAELTAVMTIAHRTNAPTKVRDSFPTVIEYSGGMKKDAISTYDIPVARDPAMNPRRRERRMGKPSHACQNRQLRPDAESGQFDRPKRLTPSTALKDSRLERLGRTR
jgi:hypothetical protein